MSNPKLCKTKRAALLDQQHSRCKLCGSYLPDTAHARHDDKLNWMLCPACMLLISSIRTAQERGVGFNEIVEYEDTGLQDDPILKTPCRKAVEDGTLLYDGYTDDPETGGWKDKLTGEPVTKRRPFKDWAEALVLHPDWAAVEERLNA